MEVGRKVAWAIAVVLAVVGLCFVVQHIVTSGVTADYESELDALRDDGERLARELEESRRIIEDLRKSHEELVTRNREIEEALQRARGRNREFAESLERAERDVAAAVSESGELTRILEEVINVLDQLFSEGGISDRGHDGNDSESGEARPP